MPGRALAAVLLCLAPAATGAMEVIAFGVRIAGLRVADLGLTGAVADGRQSAAATLRGTGAAAVLRRLRFAAQVEGRITPDGPRPDRYAETVDTGRRQTQVRLLRGDGRLLAEAAGPRDSTGAAAVDPVTAPWFGLADVAPDAACRHAAPTCDGTRRAEVRLAPRPGGPGCAGRFRRLAGSGAADLAGGRGFAVTLGHAPGRPGLLRVRRIDTETLYGKAVLERR